MKRRIVYIGILLTLLISSCSPFGSSSELPTCPNLDSIETLQTYPSAVNYKTDYHSSGNVKTVSFETSDKPEAIQAFFKDVLSKDHWQIQKVFQPLTPYSLYFTRMLAYRD